MIPPDEEGPVPAGTRDALEARLRESWAENAAAWSAAVREGRIESRGLATDRAIETAVLGLAPKSVLDVGCGEGWLARRLGSAGVAVTGFDGSEALVEAARAGGGGGRYLVVDYETFVREPGRVGAGYDVAVCNFSLLGEDVVPVLAATAAVLAPGGRLVVQTVHPLAGAGSGRYEDGWRQEDFLAMGDGFVAPMPWYFRTIGSWVAVLREGGFLIEDCREPPHPETGRPLSLLWVVRPG